MQYKEVVRVGAFLVLFVALAGSAALPQTPHPQPPPHQEVCDHLLSATSGLHGLCVAFCEARVCETDLRPAAPPADCRPSSSELLELYNQQKSPTDPGMPCALTPGCPCLTFEELDARDNPSPTAFSTITVYGKPLKATESALTLEQIEAFNLENTTQSLFYLPGVIRAPEPPSGDELIIRGVTQNRINFYYNGIPIRSTTYNTIPLNGFLFSNAEYVLLEKGPSSLSYGANSSGHVLRIHTSPFSEESFELGLSSYLGNNGKQGHQLKVSGSSRVMHYKFSGGYYSRDSFRLSREFEPVPSQTSRNRVNSDQETWEVTAVLTPRISQKHVYSLLTSFNSSEYGRPASTSRPRYRRMDFWQNTLIGMSGMSSFGPGFGLESTLYFTSLQDTMTRYNDAACTDVRSSSDWDDRTVGGRLIASKVLNSRNMAVLSFDGRRDIHHQDWHSKSSTKSTTTITALEITNESINSLEIVAGLSHNRLKPTYTSLNSDVDRKSYSALNYRVLTTHSPKDKQYSLHLGFSYTSIFPATIYVFGDALRSDEWYTVLPNPDLKEETSHNVDAGIRYRWPQKGLDLDVSFFYNKLADLIEEVRLSPTTEQAVNIASARNAGADLTVRFEFRERLTAYLSYTFLSSKNTSQDRRSDYLAYRPRHHLRIFSGYQPSKYLGMDLTASFVSERHYEIAGMPGTLDAYWLLDVGLQTQIGKHVRPYAKVTNILDEDYELAYGYPQPGTEAIIGLKLKF